MSFNVTIAEPYTFTDRYVQNVEVFSSGVDYVILKLPKASILTFGILSDTKCNLSFYISYNQTNWFPYCIAKRVVTSTNVTDSPLPLILSIPANQPISYALEYPIRANYLKIESDVSTANIQLEIASDVIW